MFVSEKWTENLIVAIKSRPVLYNKASEIYSDRNIKEKAWNEVCAQIISNWNDLSPHEKTIKGKRIQQRWKNLRTCFKRELNEQKKDKLEYAKKRRKYTYFNQLMFLIPSTEDSETKSNKNTVLKSGEEDQDSSRDNGEEEEDEEDCNVKRPVQRSKNISYEEASLNIQNKRGEEIDEDKLFLLSLIPSFKKFTEDQKFEAKMEFLSVIRRIKNSEPSIGHTQYDYQSPVTNPHTQSTSHTNNFSSHPYPVVNNYYTSRGMPPQHFLHSTNHPIESIHDSESIVVPSASNTSIPASTPSVKSENSCFSNDPLSPQSELFDL